MASFDVIDGSEHLQIGVGRLGVITEVELSIIPQDMVERQITTTSFWDFVDAMQVRSWI